MTTIANIGEHTKFISASVNFIRRQLLEHPEIFSYGQDIADVRQLQLYVKKSLENLNNLKKKLLDLDKIVKKFAADSSLQPVDLIKGMEKKRPYRIISFTVIVITGALSYFWYCKNN